jgi:NIMA (never in mitosis gene a)-related kinase
MIKDFEILKELGKGAYSTVYKVRRVVDGVEYALKKIKLIDLKEKERENALNEIRLLASIRHPNIICYKEAFFEKKINVLW